MERVVVDGLAAIAVVLAGGPLTWLLRGRWEPASPARVEHCPRCFSESLDRGLARSERVLLAALLTAAGLALVAGGLAAVGVVLGLLTAIWGPVDLGLLLVTSVVVVLGRLVLWAVLPPVRRLRARPPRRCRECRLDFPIGSAAER